MDINMLNARIETLVREREAYAGCECEDAQWIR